jgi:flagellar biosynthesis/type III secretory pathway protein FliH
MLKTWTLWVRGQPEDEHTRRWLMDFDQVVQAEIRKIERQGEERGEERGEKRGEKRGEERGLRLAVHDLCEVLGIALTTEQQAHLEALDLAGLGALRAHLKQHRSWPAGG